MGRDGESQLVVVLGAGSVSPPPRIRPSQPPFRCRPAGRRCRRGGARPGPGSGRRAAGGRYSSRRARPAMFPRLTDWPKLIGVADQEDRRARGPPPWSTAGSGGRRGRRAFRSVRPVSGSAATHRAGCSVPRRVPRQDRLAGADPPAGRPGPRSRPRPVAEHHAGGDPPGLPDGIARRHTPARRSRPRSPIDRLGDSTRPGRPS